MAGNKKGNCVACEMCGEQIQKGSEYEVMVSGELVCEYCLEESNEIRYCEICGGLFRAKDTVRMDCETYCKECARAEVRNTIRTIIPTLAEYNADELKYWKKAGSLPLSSTPVSSAMWITCGRNTVTGNPVSQRGTQRSWSREAGAGRHKRPENWPAGKADTDETLNFKEAIKMNCIRNELRKPITGRLANFFNAPDRWLDAIGGIKTGRKKKSLQDGNSGCGKTKTGDCGPYSAMALNGPWCETGVRKEAFSAR